MRVALGYKETGLRRLPVVATTGLYDSVHGKRFRTSVTSEPAMTAFGRAAAR